MFFQSSQDLCQKMVDSLLREGLIRSREVEEAFLKVQRHLFVPLEDQKRAYQFQAINLISGTSSISQPQVVACMLEGLRVKPGHKVLEIGTASGYNAALLAHLVGDPTLIYTMEYVGSLVDRAKGNLLKAGYHQINLIHGDGCEGFIPGAPYDRIIITASSFKVPLPLWSQLKEGGCLVLPYDFYNLITLLVAIEKRGEGGKGEIFGFPVLFVPLQGEGMDKEADLKKYRSFISRRKEGRTTSLALSLISSFQKEGTIDGQTVKKEWKERGKPPPSSYTLELLLNGHLQVRWERE